LFSEDLNEAIRLGGVNMDSAVLPISVSFDSIPDVTAAQPASNYIRLPETPADPVAGTPAIPGGQLNFTMVQPGANNSRQINIQVDPKLAPGTAHAQWGGTNNNILTISVSSTANLTVAQIQMAVDSASGGRPNLMMTVTAGATGTDPDVNTTGMINPISLGMSNGTNSFFQEAFQGISTIVLQHGAFHATQTANDVELEVDESGIIYAWHQGQTILLGRIDLVQFVNPEGLQQIGESYFIPTTASGPPQVRIPHEEGDDAVVASALEMSNVDLSQEFSDMIITQRGFQANSRVITVSDTMLEELVNLKR
jgi:flagellar hook protein FlgE